MCIYNEPSVLRKELNSDVNFFTGWKIYKVSKTKRITPYYGYTKERLNMDTNEIVSNSKRITPYTTERCVERGIHVYKRRPLIPNNYIAWNATRYRSIGALRRSIKMRESTSIIVKVYGNKKDLLASSKTYQVFKKVYLDDKDWKILQQL